MPPLIAPNFGGKMNTTGGGNSSGNSNGDVFLSSDNGSPNGEGDSEIDESNLSDNVGEISAKTGLSEDEVNAKIHEAKNNLPKSSPIRNPNVYVDTVTGEIYPQLPNGGYGDSIRNIFD